MKDSLQRTVHSSRFAGSVSAPAVQQCPGCGAWVYGGGYCETCLEESGELEGLFGEWQRQSELHSLAEIEKAARQQARGAFWRRTGKRMENCAYFLACWTGLMVFFWGTRSFWIGLFEMWFGGGR